MHIPRALYRKQAIQRTVRGAKQSIILLYTD